MKSSITLLITLLSFSVLPSLAQTDSLKFQEKEKGFITKDGCKILVKQYYGLSENRYYFALETGKNYFYIDTNNIASYHNIKIGKNKKLASSKHPGLKQKIWVGAVCFGVIFVPIGAAGSAFLLDEASAHGGIFIPGFFILDGVYGYVWLEVFQDAIFKVRLVKAFKTGKPYVCQ